MKFALLASASVLTLSLSLGSAVQGATGPDLLAASTSAGPARAAVRLAENSFDDPVNHDANDDNGSGGQGADDGPNHDIGDDNGGDDNGGDESGGDNSSGSGSSGSGSSGSGSSGSGSSGGGSSGSSGHGGKGSGHGGQGGDD